MSALKDELTADPLGWGYAGLLPDSPGSVADLLNAPTRSFAQTTFVTARGILADVEDGAQILDALQAAGAVNSTVKWAMVYLQKDSGVDVGHPRTRAMLDQLAQTGVITQAQADELKALALQPGSRAVELGIGAVTEVEVCAAWKE